MIEYTKYTLEGASAFLIVVVAYKIYRMRCNTTSKCCKESFNVDLHNDGNNQRELIIGTPAIQQPINV
tara:strand:- start:2159 stop:2362 length:204 start_codon:yes stop_codon:yes gene_type:complete